jgi:hypothetical protein
MGVKAPPTPVKHCACRIIKPGQNTADPDKTTKCREQAARFVDLLAKKDPPERAAAASD